MTPEGKKSKHAYVYSSNSDDICVGDIVIVDGEEGEIEAEVLSGEGGPVNDPQLKLKSIVSLSTFTASASSLTLLQSATNRNDEDDTAPLLQSSSRRKFKMD